MADFSEKLRAKAATIPALNANTEYESKNRNVEYRLVEILRELPDNSLIPSLKPDDYQNLFESIKLEMKIRTPVHISKDNTVLCGNNRLKIAKEIGIKEIPVIVVDVPKEKYFFYALEDNLFRRQLNDAQKAELILMLKPEIRKHAAERSKQNLKKGNQKPEDMSSNTVGNTSASLAARVGISKDYLNKYEKVKKENPELAEQVKKDAIKLKQAYRKIKTTLPAPLSGKFGIRKIKKDESRRIITVICEDYQAYFHISRVIDTAAEELKKDEEAQNG